MIYEHLTNHTSREAKKELGRQKEEQTMVVKCRSSNSRQQRNCASRDVKGREALRHIKYKS